MNIDGLAETMRAKSVKDECGDWRIVGKRGDITEDGKGFSIWFRMKSKAMMKKAHEIVSKFSERRQNGDTEGIYFLKASAVNPEVAKTLVKALKIRQKRQLSAETIAKLTERISKIRPKSAVGSPKQA